GMLDCCVFHLAAGGGLQGRASRFLFRYGQASRFFFSVAQPCERDLIARIIIRREWQGRNLITVNPRLVVPPCTMSQFALDAVAPYKQRPDFVVVSRATSRRLGLGNVCLARWLKSRNYCTVGSVGACQPVSIGFSFSTEGHGRLLLVSSCWILVQYSPSTGKR